MTLLFFILYYQEKFVFINNPQPSSTIKKLKFAANIYPLNKYNATAQPSIRCKLSPPPHPFKTRYAYQSRIQTRWCTKHTIGHHALHCTPSTPVNITQFPIPHVSAVLLLQPNITSASLNRCAETIPVATGDISECTTVQKHKLMSLWFSLLKGSCHDAKTIVNVLANF
jgi:hypothetical protein